MTKQVLAFLSSLFLLCVSASYSLAADKTETTENKFSIVRGSVKVASGGGTTRKVTQGDAAFAGETIQVGPKAQAQLTLFDGSTVDLSANSKITLKEVQKSSDKDKVISLKLALGKVFAQVKKLLSAKSSFEIEAGGVVCGVRGTAFSMDYDGGKKLDLNVLEGRVSATSGGNILFFNAGQGCHFVNGQAAGTGGGSNNNGGKSGGKGGTTGGSSNGNSNGSGGNNSGSNSNGGSNNNGGGTGGSTDNNGGTNGTGNNNQETGNPTTGNNPPSGNNPSNLDPNNCLGDLNNSFTTGVLINGDNSLTTAQQNVNIHLVVPGREAVP